MMSHNPDTAAAASSRRPRATRYLLVLLLTAPLSVALAQGCTQAPKQAEPVAEATAAFTAGADNVLCCHDVNECSDGDDSYQGCTMPAIGALAVGAPACPASNALACLPCVGGEGLGCDADDADGDGWTEVTAGNWQCDGEVRRYADVSKLANQWWTVLDLEEKCNTNTWPCYGLNVCSDISEVSCERCSEQQCWNQYSGPFVDVCPGEGVVKCMDVGLENGNWVGCCVPGNDNCIPAGSEADCATPEYTSLGFTVPAWCVPCNNGSNQAESCTNGWEFFPHNDPDPSCDVFDCPQRINGCIPVRFECAGNLINLNDYSSMSNACDTPICNLP